MNYSYPILHPQVACRTIEGSAVIVLADAGEVTILNQVGTRVWELIDGATSVQQIIDQIVAEYDTSPEQAREDVESFLGQLRELNAIELRESPYRTVSSENQGES